jgi:hypothetical protein
MKDAAVGRALRSKIHVPGSHWTLRELSIVWNIGVDKLRAIFIDEPGVVKHGRAKKGKRGYTTIRIPEDVAARVLRRRTEI